MQCALQTLVLSVVAVTAVLSKPPEGYRATADSYSHHGHHHPTPQTNSQDQRPVPVPLHDVPRVRGVYIDGKPVIAGVPQAVPLTPIKHPNTPSQAKTAPRPAAFFAPFQAAGPEYYDDFAPVSPPSASAYIPTAPYPSSIYGRPPFWLRLQRWNPFSRYYRTSYTIGAPDYSSLPPYGYVVPPVMVIPTGPGSKLEPVFSPLAQSNSVTTATSQRRFGRY